MKNYQTFNREKFDELSYEEKSIIRRRCPFTLTKKYIVDSIEKDYYFKPLPINTKIVVIQDTNTGDFAGRIDHFNNLKGIVLTIKGYNPNLRRYNCVFPSMKKGSNCYVDDTVGLAFVPLKPDCKNTLSPSFNIGEKLIFLKNGFKEDIISPVDPDLVRQGSILKYVGYDEENNLFKTKFDEEHFSNRMHRNKSDSVVYLDLAAFTKDYTLFEIPSKEISEKTYDELNVGDYIELTDLEFAHSLHEELVRFDLGRIMNYEGNTLTIMFHQIYFDTFDVLICEISDELYKEKFVKHLE